MSDTPKVVVNKDTPFEAEYDLVTTEAETVAEFIERLKQLPQDLPLVVGTGVNAIRVVRRAKLEVRKEHWPGEVSFAINETMKPDPDRVYVFLG